MTEVLLFATILAPVILALVELVKKSVPVPKNYIPLIALLIGVFIGFASYPFTELQLDLRLWAGGLAGLASTGLFELGSKRDGTTEGLK